MQMNLDCFKDVLQYCVQNIDYEEFGHSWRVKPVNLDMLYEALNSKYKRKYIMRSTLQLYECGFIRFSTRFPENKPYLERCTIEDVSFKGYQFMESIKEPSIWEKTKSVVSKVGNHTLEFVEGVAHDIAIESAKQAVTIMMTEQ